MILHRKDVEKLKDIMDKFPDVTAVELRQENASGIGSCTYITFAQEINGLHGSFEIEINGVENW
jgi:hypothetical protein